MQLSAIHRMTGTNNNHVYQYILYIIIYLFILYLIFLFNGLVVVFFPSRHARIS